MTRWILIAIIAILAAILGSRDYFGRFARRRRVQALPRISDDEFASHFAEYDVPSGLVIGLRRDLAEAFEVPADGLMPDCVIREELDTWGCSVTDSLEDELSSALTASCERCGLSGLAEIERDATVGQYVRLHCQLYHAARASR